MNPTLSLLMNRKSVRSYTDQPIADSEKQAILAATLRAPTAGAMMLYSIIEVTSQPLKDRLAVTCDHQPFIASAPWVLLFVADYQRWMDFYSFRDAAAQCEAAGRSDRQPAEGDFLLACMDALIAAQTAVTAAESLGIGSCYIGDILENYEEHQQLFNLPRYVAPIALLCFGYPTQNQIERKQTERFPQNMIVHENAYRRVTPEEMERVRPANADSRLDPVLRAYLRKFTADFSLEMSRSARKILANWHPESPDHDN